MKAKKSFVCKSTISKLLANHIQEMFIIAWIAHLKFTEKRIAYAFMLQSTIKLSGPDKINFQTIGIL